MSDTQHPSGQSDHQVAQQPGTSNGSPPPVETNASGSLRYPEPVMRQQGLRGSSFGSDIPGHKYPLPVIQQDAPPPYAPRSQNVVYVAPRPTPGPQYEQQMVSVPVDGLCNSGEHDWVTSFGFCGICTAIVCFPIGLICLCADMDRKCARCGVHQLD